MYFNKYLKGVSFFLKGLKASKDDMWTSLQVLVIATFVLSFILYFVEHSAQPDVYTNPWDSFLWGIMNYLDNPGDFSPGEPVTYVGRLIAIVISVIKILIFAVPAGLVANGFSEAMEEDKKRRKDAVNAERIIKSMHVHCSLLKGVRFWPKRWYRFSEISTNLDIDESDIISAVRSNPHLRLRDLSTWLTTSGGVRPEMMVVELCYANSSYGYTNLREQNVDAKHRKVTIVVSAGASEASLGYFAYHLARIGGFNVVINEMLSSNADADENRCVVSGIYDYQYNDVDNYPKLHQFVDDIKACVLSKEDWIIVLSPAASPKDAEKKHQKIRLRLTVNDNEVDNSIADCTGTNSHEQLQAFYDDLCLTMKDKHDIEPYIVYSKGNPTTLRNYIREKFDSHPNVIDIGIADDYRVFGTDVKNQWMSIYTMACLIHRHFGNDSSSGNCQDWTVADVKKHRLELIPDHKGDNY